MKRKLTDEERKANRAKSMKLWLIRSREQERIRTKKRRLENPEEHNRLNKAFLIRNPGYGGRLYINRQEKLAGRKKPKRCDVCKKPGKICFDHCHKSKTFRGWLCFHCNIALGCVKDSTKTLRALADYIDAHKANPKVTGQQAKAQKVYTKAQEHSVVLRMAKKQATK